MSDKRGSNPLALAVLTLLNERPMHPYEMSRTLRERHKEDSIKLNYGSLYSVVESLVRRGLVEAQETVRTGKRPERTIYAITEAGSAVMTDWLAELISTPKKEFTQFEAALSLLAALPPDEVIGLLEQRLNNLRFHRTAHEALREQAAASNFPGLFLIEADYTFALLAAEIEFVSSLLDELRTGTLGGYGVWQRMHELRDAGASPAEIEATVADEFKEELRFFSDLGGDS